MNGSVFQTYDLQTIVRYGIAIIIFLSMLLAVAYTVWGGLLMVVSGGDEAKVKAAVNHMRYAVLGIIVLVAVIFIAPLFLNLFGLGQYGQYFSPAVILSTIQEISAHILGQSTTSGVYNTTDTVVVPSDSGFTDL